MATDFESEGLLEGLDGPAREARRELLEQLADAGVELKDLRVATEQGRLSLLPVERLMGGEERYSFEEIVELSGLEAGFLERLWRALGLAVPEAAERRFTDADLEAAKRAAAFKAAGLSEESILEISRVMSRAMANVAATMGSITVQDILRHGDDLAKRFEDYEPDSDDQRNPDVFGRPAPGSRGSLGGREVRHAGRDRSTEARLLLAHHRIADRYLWRSRAPAVPLQAGGMTRIRRAPARPYSTLSVACMPAASWPSSEHHR